MNISSKDIKDFFEKEKQFLNNKLNLTEVLKREGWMQVPSRFKDTSRFHRKGEIVDVTYNSGKARWEWKSSEGSGTSIDLLMNKRERNAYEEHVNAVRKLRGYSYIVNPAAAKAFYSPYLPILQMLDKRQLSPNEKIEHEFLKTEVSIFKVASVLGYKARPETSSGKTYFVKDAATLSLTRKDNDSYLWYDYSTKEGGLVQALIERDLGVSSSEAHSWLKDYALHILPKVKLDAFLALTDGPDNQQSRDGSFRSMIVEKGYINDLMIAYNEMPVFSDWGAPHVLSDSLPRHFRMPYLNPVFSVVSNLIGEGRSQALTRVALIAAGAEHIQPEKVSEAISTEGLKPETKLLMSHICDLQKGKIMIETVKNLFTSTLPIPTPDISTVQDIRSKNQMSL